MSFAPEYGWDFLGNTQNTKGGNWSKNWTHESFKASPYYEQFRLLFGNNGSGLGANSYYDKKSNTYKEYDPYQRNLLTQMGYNFGGGKNNVNPNVYGKTYGPTAPPTQLPAPAPAPRAPAPAPAPAPRAPAPAPGRSPYFGGGTSSAQMNRAGARGMPNPQQAMLQSFARMLYGGRAGTYGQGVAAGPSMESSPAARRPGGRISGTTPFYSELG